MRRTENLARLSVILPAAIMLLGGCTSTGFLGFLATNDQVNQKLAEQSKETQKNIDQLDTQVKSLEGEMKTYKDQSDQINALLDQTRALQKLAAGVEDRLASLPRETLLQLADLIQTALQKKGQTAPSSSGATGSTPDAAAGGGK